MQTAAKVFLANEIIDRCGLTASPLTLRLLYDVADEICDREELGDELVDCVYERLAQTCESIGLDPITFE